MEIELQWPHAAQRLVDKYFNLEPKDVWRSRFCGPSSDYVIEAEYERLVSLCRRMQTEGYRLWRYRGGAKTFFEGEQSRATVRCDAG